ncbi:MAG: MBL fold metallo-hydrolase [Spirochaetota bacterium]|nr:MBL fold metallo-hydrolase [Spirochaetota bacterium]
MKLKWINHACVEVMTNNGKVIYFDPFQLSGDLDKADIVLISHDHPDHLSIDDIKKVADSNTTIVIPKTCNLEGDFKVIKMEIGSSEDINGIKIEAVPSYTDKLPTHPKENEWNGYIINADGNRIYHAGDTGEMVEMCDLKDIDVACIPVGGQYTMGFEEATDCVKKMIPKIVVPIHNWDKPLEPFKEMVEKELPNVKVEILSNKTLEL